MAKPCNENLIRALDLTNRMIRVADKAFDDGADGERRKLLCLMREMAFKLRHRVQCECDKHKMAGNWD